MNAAGGRSSWLRSTSRRSSSCTSHAALPAGEPAPLQHVTIHVHVMSCLHCSIKSCAGACVSATWSVKIVWRLRVLGFAVAHHENMSSDVCPLQIDFPSISNTSHCGGEGGPRAMLTCTRNVHQRCVNMCNSAACLLVGWFLAHTATHCHDEVNRARKHDFILERAFHFIKRRFGQVLS